MSSRTVDRTLRRTLCRRRSPSEDVWFRPQTTCRRQTTTGFERRRHAAVGPRPVLTADDLPPTEDARRWTARRPPARDAEVRTTRRPWTSDLDGGRRAAASRLGQRTSVGATRGGQRSRNGGPERRRSPVARGRRGRAAAVGRAGGVRRVGTTASGKDPPSSD